MSITRNGIHSLPTLALLLIAGLFAVGCCCTCPKYLGEKGPEPVNILVTWDVPSRQIVVFPDTAHLCEGKQFPRWAIVGAPEGTTMTISFDEGSPFSVPGEKRTLKMTEAKVYQLPVAAKGTAGRRYKYTVTLNVPGVNPPPSLDPYIEIWR